jgi:hypothetical protein
MAVAATAAIDGGSVGRRWLWRRLWLWRRRQQQ